MSDVGAGLELKRWGTGFADPTIEARYVVWERARATTFTRAGLFASIASWSVAGAVLSWLTPAGLAPWLGAIAVTLSVIVLALVATYRTPLARWDAALSALANVLAGLTAVGVLALHVEDPTLAAGGAVIVCFYACALLRMRPWYAVLSIASYFVLDLCVIGGAIGPASGISSRALQLLLLVTGYVGGIVVVFVNANVWRRLYVSEQIIEEQKATIAHERARSEELLKRELSHQVAERSRELGAVLAKSDVTLDARGLSTGERFAERYKIVSALGAGGMGAVYEVERVTDGGKLALKAVLGEVSGASAARFAREAEIGARIRHPNLISIVDVGVWGGIPFLVMELVRGGSLEAQRARFGDVAWALPILKQIAEGLAALHEAGVVHRDLKPANVLLVEGGVAKISDFGISRFGALDDDAAVDARADTIAVSPKPRLSDLTGTGMIMGTPLYMAPEGAKSARALDGAADVFAFGIIASEMLHGRSPFPVPAFMLAMAEQPIPPPPRIDDPRVSPALAALLHACLNGDPLKRPRARVIAAAMSSG